jgi:RNA 2',3'-cyclic 3'-phosphodiesterase
MFVAVEVPENVRLEVAEATKSLRRVLERARVSWTRPEQFHLTLKFLGNVDPAQLGPLTAALKTACSGVVPLGLTAAGIGLFPSARAPRVIWVGVQDAAGLLAPLQSRIEQACAPFTAEQSEGRFQGHVTLARIKQIHHHDAAELVRLVETLREPRFGSWTAGSVELMRSELGPTGAKHSLVEEIQFLTRPQESA